MPKPLLPSPITTSILRLDFSKFGQRHPNHSLFSPTRASIVRLRPPLQLGPRRPVTTIAHPPSGEPITNMSSGTQAKESQVAARNLSSTPLNDADAKWVGLKAIEWMDPTGKVRKWECADRKTRKGDVDAIAIFTIILRPSSPPSVILITQFRPTANQKVVELPAGLVDEGEEGDEGAKRAALRELREETGYGGTEGGAEVTIKDITPPMLNDPGLSSANMKMASVVIRLSDDAPQPIAHPDPGEFIERHIVPVKGLWGTLKEFAKKGYALDARLAHLAMGMAMAQDPDLPAS